MRRKASGPSSFEWCYMLLVQVAFGSMSFIAGTQETGRDSLNLIHILQNKGDGGNQLTQTLSICLYAGCAILLARHARPKTFLLLGYPLCLLLLWTFMTIAWSVDPSVSFRRAVALAGTTGLSLYLGIRFDPQQLLRLLAYSTSILLVASLIIGIVAPVRGFDFSDNFRGVFEQKNAMGRYAIITILVVIGRLLQRRSIGTLATIGAGALGVMAIICLGLAHSASIVPVLLSVLIALVIARLIRRSDATSRSLIIPIAVCGAVGAGSVLYDNWASLVALLGRDPDMSGRTEVWEFVAKMIFQNPLIGYGYQAFWEGSRSPGAAFWQMTGNGVPNAHSGWLQLTLDTGGVGVLLFMVAIVIMAVNLFRLLRQMRSSPWFFEWAVSFLTFYLVTSFFEAILWVGDYMIQMLFLYIVIRSNIMMRQAAVSSHTQSFGILRTGIHAPQRTVP